MSRRQRILLWGATLAAILSTGGLGASTWVRSPAEAAADTKPPTPSVLTAGVVFKELRTSTIFRGTFTATGTVSFDPKPPLAPDGTVGATYASEVPVVTAVGAKAGQRVRAGKVLAEVGYRPVVALPGRVPALRDLVQGDTGPDVAELQRALGTLGYGRGSDPLGTFGSGTTSAVRRFYSAIGYPVPARTAATPQAAGDADAATAGSRADGKESPGRRRAVMVPASEVMYVPSLPATVTRLNASIGEKAGSPLITLSSTGLRLRGRLDPALKSTVKAGQAVQVLDEVSGTTYKGRIDDIGQIVAPNTDGNGQSQRSDGDTPYIPVDTSPASGHWDARLLGGDVRITAYTDVSYGKVLAVPEGAITTTANGTVSVTVVGPGGRERRVVVVPGATADGLVAVDPAGRALKEGDRVVVGQR